VGEEPATVALAWLLTRPAVTGPIIGPRTPDQFDGALRAVEITLDDKVLSSLDGIFPGYKPSPEEYAW
jgi:aryl-alcohol dehydrogenase-like predicted oxidoreductase